MHIPTFAKKIENSDFLKKTFHSVELDDSSPGHLAGYFAAKEAFFKAIEDFPRWLNIEVYKKASGKPIIKHTRTNIQDIDVSISHDGDYAIAVVVLLLEDRE